MPPLMRQTNLRERYVLFTNLEGVTIGSMRAFCHALLLEEVEGARRRARGFGTDPAWPVFDLFVPSIGYAVVDGQGSALAPGEAILSGAVLQLEGGPALGLVACNRSCPIDVQAFEGTGGGHGILRIWSVLQRKVVRYWKEDSNVPMLSWQPARLVKGLLGEDGSDAVVRPRRV